jgi:quinol monooxygenase YgiN
MENKIVRHILLIKFSPNLTSEQFDEVVQAFHSLFQKIEGFQSYEYGENNSPEGLNKGLTHVFNITFRDIQSRDAYLTHPEHVQFGNWFSGLGVIEDIVVVDYIPVE